MLNKLKHLRTNENVLIAIDALLHSKSTFLSTFLLTYMIRISIDNSPTDYIIFNLVSYVFMAVFALILLRFAKKHTLLAWRIGILFSVIHILVIITLSSYTEIFPYILAFIVGLEAMLYWRPFCFFSITEISNTRRLRFQSVCQIIAQIIKIVMPIVLGLLITDTGYINTAILILIISLVQLLLSVLFRPSRPIKLPIHKVSVVMKHIKKSVSLRKTFWLQFLRGMLISGSAFLIIPIILVYNYTESDFDLGLYTSIGAIISILVLMLFRRVHKKQVSNIFLYIVAFIVIISSVITMLYPSALTSVILYIVSIALVYCFFNVIAVNKVQNTIKTAVKNNSFVIDMESISEVFLCLGRIFSLSILLFLVLFGRMDYLVCFAVFSALLIIPIIMLTRTKS